MPTRTPSCIIIGAGLAGLTAALELVQRGWKVDIIEAFPRAGGRVFTYHFDQAPDLNCELGGEWIGDQHKHMKDLCTKFKLSLQQHRYSFAFPSATKAAPFLPAGGSPFAPELLKKLDDFLADFNNPKIYDQGKQKELDRYDWWTWLRNMNFERPELLQRDLMDSTDFGESIRLTSAFIAAGEYALSNDYDEMDWKIIGGNQRLPQAMQEFISQKQPEAFHFNTQVTEIRQKGHRVTVIGNSLTESAHDRNPSLSLEADFCICAIPARTLNSITWDPPLPDDQSAAADQLQYCRIVKTVVLYRTRFWEQSTLKPSGGGYSWFTSGVSDFCFDATQSQDHDKRGILCSYAVGDKADDIAQDSESRLKAWITNDIAGACGLDPSAAQPLDICRQPWQKNPFTQGAYAFYRSGQWFTVRPLLRRTHRRVHFAGEHLDDKWQGFMEGAVRTGHHAAMSI